MDSKVARTDCDFSYGDWSVVFAPRVDQLEALMLDMPQAPCNVRHIFGPGIYIRELTMPAGTYAIGHRQKTVHMNALIKGRVTMMNDDGSSKEISAPLVFVGQPGRKLGYVNEDVVWLNIYATDETSIEKLEATYLDKSPAFNNRMNRIEYHPDDDYKQMLADLGVTEEIVRAQSINELDQIPFPYGGYKVKVGPSLIHGDGLFATADIAENELICPARIDGKRTPAGRYTNHAKQPNARMVSLENGDIHLMALRDIPGCRGGENGEEIVVDYRESVITNLQSWRQK